MKISISSFFCVAAEPRCCKGDADKILDQIRLQEVPHVHLCARAGLAKEVADAHGVNPVTLYEWKKQLLGGEKSTPSLFTIFYMQISALLSPVFSFFTRILLVDPLLQLRHVGNDTHQTVTLC